MQAVGNTTNTITGTVYHKPVGTRYPRRGENGKKDYGAQRCRNPFLKTVFTPIAPQIVTRWWEEEEYNYITRENYEYLLKSAMNYASLLGVELGHNPGRSAGEGILNLHDGLAGIIGTINLNLETRGNKLVFVLWKYHPWRDYTFYWMPVKFTESLPPRLKKIARSFIHHFMHSNGMETINNTFDMESVLNWTVETLDDYDPMDRERNLRLVKSYQSGKIYRLMDMISNKCHYKDLPAALQRYIPQNEFERSLISLFTEGLQFIGRDKPSIMSYGYDPLDDEENEYYPVCMERMVRVVYDLDDFVTGIMMDLANGELSESYDISPATSLAISPDTGGPFSMDGYPEKFYQWFDKFNMTIALHDEQID